MTTSDLKTGKTATDLVLGFNARHSPFTISVYHGGPLGTAHTLKGPGEFRETYGGGEDGGLMRAIEAGRSASKFYRLGQVSLWAPAKKMAQLIADWRKTGTAPDYAPLLKVSNELDAAMDGLPDLLSALKRLAHVAVWDDETDRAEFDAAMAEAEAAIAKAECN